MSPGRAGIMGLRFTAVFGTAVSQDTNRPIPHLPEGGLLNGKCKHRHSVAPSP